MAMITPQSSINPNPPKIKTTQPKVEMSTKTTTKKANATTKAKDDSPQETTSSTMPNKFVLSSRKLFDTKAPWKINNSLLGQLKTDHYIALYDLSNKDTYDYGTEIYKRLSKILKNFPFENKVFIGYKKDCLLAPSLKVQFKIDFDTVILIDNPYPQQAYDPILKSSNIYNISTREKNALDYLPAAKINQLIPTMLPAHMSNRVHLETTGILTYGVYNTNYISPDVQSILLEL